MRTNFWQLATLGIALSTALGACDDGDGADDVADTGTVPDAETPDGTDDTGSPDADVDAAVPDAEPDAGGPTMDGNQNLDPYEAPPVCDEASVMAPPFEIVGCGYTFDPPDWQSTNLFGDPGILDARPSCGAPAGEGATPQNVHLTYPTPDADTNIGILWMTDYATTASDVRIGTDPENLDRWVRGFSFSHALLDGERRVHEVHVCNLQPSTTYYYQVGGADVWSPVYSFVTAPAFGSDETFTFAATGDTRSTTQAMWALTLDEIESKGADLLIFSGDAVDTGTLQFQWDVWWNQASATDTTQRLAALPMLFAHGNHDLVGDGMWAMTAYPNDEQNFYIRYGNTLFIMLDDSGSFRTNLGVETEIRDFLREALEAHPDVTWRVVSHHKPIYSASNHGSTRVLQEHWMPIYEEFGVDLVLNGHNHNYERSCPVRGGQCVAMGEGTNYIVAAGIGAPLYGTGSEWWTEVALKVPSYVLFTVSDESITGVAYDPTTGAQIDSVTITKQ